MSTEKIEEIVETFCKDQFKLFDEYIRLISTIDKIPGSSNYKELFQMFIKMQKSHITQFQHDILYSSMPPLIDSVSVKQENFNFNVNINEIESLRAKYIDEAIQEIDSQFRTGSQCVKYNCEKYNILADRVIKHYTDIKCSVSKSNTSKGIIVEIIIL